MVGLAPSGTSLIDVLDRVLDRGIVIDAWMRYGLVGLDLHLVEVESRIVVASIDTYLTQAHALPGLSLVSPRRSSKQGRKMTRRRIRHIPFIRPPAA
jgi:Gas vesicle protein